MEVNEGSSLIRRLYVEFTEEINPVISIGSLIIIGLVSTGYVYTVFKAPIPHSRISTDIRNLESQRLKTIEELTRSYAPKVTPDEFQRFLKDYRLEGFGPLYK